MSIPDVLAERHGLWHGQARLHLPGDPVRQSVSEAQVTPMAQGKFLALNYSWAFEGEPQSGQVLLGQEDEGGSVVASFIDSWHMGDKMMVCRGAVTPGAVIVRGQYAVEGHPDWGWRIDIDVNPGLRVAMYNVSPEGDEEIGFELIYTER